MTRSPSAVGRGRALRWTPALLFVLAGAYFLAGIGLAMGWELGWIDEGIIVYQSWRTAAGELPYRDFHHVYGPSVFYFNAALLRLFGPDLAVIRQSLAVVKALIALAVYLLARRVSTGPLAAAMVLLFTVVWGGPTWLFNTPYAGHYAMMLALAGIVVALALPRRRGLGALLAGLCFGLAATFKVTAGLLPFFAMILFLIADAGAGGPEGPPQVGWERATRAMRLGALAAVALVSVLVVAAGGSEADSYRLGTSAVLLAPMAMCVAAVGRRELTRRPGSGAETGGARALLLCGAGMAAPLIAYWGLFAYQGAASGLLRDVFLLPRQLHWFTPIRAPSLRTSLLSAATVLALATSRRSGARGRGAATRIGWVAAVMLGVIGALVGPPGQTSAARSLDPGHWAAAAYEAFYYLPFVTVAAGVPWLFETVRPAAPSSASLLVLLFAAANLLLLYPCADAWHVQMMLPAFLPLLAEELAPRRDPDGRRSRLAEAFTVTLVLGLATPFALQRWQAQRMWPAATPSFARARGISHPHPKFSDAAALVRFLGSEPARGRAVFVLSGETMIDFLSARVSVLEQEEYVVHMIAVEAVTPETASRLADEPRMIRRLKVATPLIIDYAGSPVGPRIRRIFPRLDRYVQAHCPVRESFGGYQVLDCSSAPGTAGSTNPAPRSGRSAPAGSRG